MTASSRGIAVTSALAAMLAVSAAPAGATGFTVNWELPPRASSFGVALGDVDGDGDVDAYVADFDGPDTLWHNDGSGHFTDSGQALDSGRGSMPVLALLDNDLYLDLFLARHLSASRVWLNDGTGVLGDSAQSIGLGTSRRGVAVGLLDGDADLDVFLPSDDNSQPNEVWLNDGSGSFTDSGQSAGTYWTRMAVLGDVDGDTDLDVALGNNGANKLWLNDGSGTFSDSGQTVGSGGTFGMAFGRLDGDADLDLFIANGYIGGDADEVWLNDGSGTFTNSGQSLGNDYSFSVVLFDADGDTDLDAFVGTNAGEMDRLWLNDGNAVFTDSGQTLGVGGGLGAAVADVDGDTDLDLFVANRYQPDQVWLNDGNGNLSDSGQLLGSFEAECVDLADLDGDGDLDAFVGSVAGTARVLLNDGSARFTDSNQWLVNGFGNNNGKIALADLDGDLDLDAYVANSPFSSAADNADRVWLNDGSGHFADSGQLIGAENTGAVAIGDVDGDLDLDVVAGNAPYFASTGEDRLWLNDGSGNLSDSGQALSTGNTRALALATLDGDTDLDLFVGISGGGNQVWLNNGSGVFTDSGQVLGSGNTFAVAVGDLDGDTDLDAFVGNNGANTVWFNDGNGVFTDSGQLLGFSNTAAVHLFDYEGDGDLDAWVTNGQSGSQANKVWLNDGSGVFTDSGLVLGASGSVDSAMADLDGDGDEDVFVANIYGDSRVWTNTLYAPSVFATGMESGDLSDWSAVVP